MAKAFFGASRSEINRFKNEVRKDYGLGKATPRKKSRKRKKR